MRYILALIAGLSLPACATAVSGSNTAARFDSRPTGAEVRVETADGKRVRGERVETYACTAPCTLALQGNKKWRAEFTKPGYKPIAGLLIPKPTGRIKTIAPARNASQNFFQRSLMRMGLTGTRVTTYDLQPSLMVAELVPTRSTKLSTVNAPQTEINMDGRSRHASTSDADATPPTLQTNERKEGSVVKARDEVNTKTRSSISNDDTDKAPPSERYAARTSKRKIKSRGAPTYLTDGIQAYKEGEKQQREYKPGEPAPHDEISSELNRRVLDVISEE